MRIYDIEITAEQQKAGLGAMKGAFRSGDVRAALAAAGVPEINENIPQYRPREVLQRAADRLLQKEKKAGRIEAVNNRNWRVVAPQS